MLCQRTLSTLLRFFVIFANNLFTRTILSNPERVKVDFNSFNLPETPVGLCCLVFCLKIYSLKSLCEYVKFVTRFRHPFVIFAQTTKLISLHIECLLCSIEFDSIYTQSVVEFIVWTFHKLNQITLFGCLAVLNFLVCKIPADGSHPTFMQIFTLWMWHFVSFILHH